MSLNSTTALDTGSRNDPNLLPLCVEDSEAIKLEPETEFPEADSLLFTRTTSALFFSTESEVIISIP